MTQPPNHGNDPQWNPDVAGSTPPEQPGRGDLPHPDPSASGGQSAGDPGPGGQAHGTHGEGPGPDGQTFGAPGPHGPEGQPPGPHGGGPGPDGQAFGAPGPHAHPGAHGTPARGTKFGVKQLVSAIVVVAVLGVGAFFFWQNYQKDAALAEGNCIVVSGETTDADHELADCDDQSVYTYLVGEVIEGDGVCTDENAASYSITETSRRGGDESVQKVACLVPQMFEGACYAESGDASDLEPVECTDPGAVLKVTSVSEEADATCEGELEMPLSFTQPARTYCLGAAE